MTLPIAFVSRTDKASEAQWISTLAKALPKQLIISYDEMSAEDRKRVEFAIVANPDPACIANLPNLKWMHSLWAGVERLVSELGPNAAPIVRLTDPELSRVMAEAVLAWTHYLQRDMPAYRQQQNDNIWQEREYRHPKNLTVGVLGLGELGSEAAKTLSHAGFNVMGWSRTQKTLSNVECVSGDLGLADLLKQSDIIVCVVPLTPQTRGIINAERLKTMKNGAQLINFARGPVIDADALLDALDNGKISHAVLDVFEIEPLPSASPLWKHKNVTLLPHISAPTSAQSSAAIVAKNFNHWLETGVLPVTVDLIRGY